LLLGTEELGLLNSELGHAIEELPGLSLVIAALEEQRLDPTTRDILLRQELPPPPVEVLDDRRELLCLFIVQAESLAHHAPHLGTNPLLELGAVRGHAAPTSPLGITLREHRRCARERREQASHEHQARRNPHADPPV
jgi:hypothetical protein